jgi:hypothetical protein
MLAVGSVWMFGFRRSIGAHSVACRVDMLVRFASLRRGLYWVGRGARSFAISVMSGMTRLSGFV